MTLIPYAGSPMADKWRPIDPLRPAWTEERVTRMKLLWREGLSAGLIARELGGVTRAAVIGKLHRLGFAGRGAPTASIPRQQGRRTYSTKRRPQSEVYARALGKPELSARPVDLVEPESKLLTILQLTDKTCKWPSANDRPPFAYCGADAVEGEPYCAFHEDVAHTEGSQRDFDRIANRTMGGMLGLGKAVVSE